MSRRRKEKARIRKIAQERIEILLTKADKVYPDDPQLAQRYGDIAKRIAMKARISIPQKWRLRFCSKCKKFVYPGISARVRIKSKSQSRLVYYCTLCSSSSRSKVLKNSS